MAWDWLAPDDAVHGKRDKVKVPMPGNLPNQVVCGSCMHTPGDCRCDPKLGRPAKWFEFDPYDDEGAW